MVKHVILWNLKEEYSAEEKEQIKKGMKEGLESLKGVVPGLLEIEISINPLPSANCDVMSTIDYRPIITKHIDSEADITLIYGRGEYDFVLLLPG